jgi:hypothetical protein
MTRETTAIALVIHPWIDVFATIHVDPKMRPAVMGSNAFLIVVTNYCIL